MQVVGEFADVLDTKLRAYVPNGRHRGHIVAWAVSVLNLLLAEQAHPGILAGRTSIADLQHATRLATKRLPPRGVSWP